MERFTIATLLTSLLVVLPGCCKLPPKTNPEDTGNPAADAGAGHATDGRGDTLSDIDTGAGTGSDTDIPVDTMVKRHAGVTYVFTVSMRPGDTTASFDLRDFEGTATLEVLGEDRTLTAVDGAFADDFNDFTVHIYSVSNP